MQGDGAPAALLRHPVMQLDAVGDVALRVEHHRPSQLGDLTGAETGLDAEQDHDPIPPRVAAYGRLLQQRVLLRLR